MWQLHIILIIFVRVYHFNWAFLYQWYWMYTLPQKKRNFNFQIFHGDPGPGSVTPGHVHQWKCSGEQQAKCTNGIWPKVHLPALLPKRKATSEKLRFFWGRV